MGTTALRKFLQSLCCNSCWNYVVFWKLQHQSQMLLTWEVGYCDIPKQGDSMESTSDNICFEGLDEMSSSKCDLSTYGGTLGGYPVLPAVDYMSSFQYALGDGVVGEVAYTGNYRWVLSESISYGEFNTNVVPECPDEWLFQFAAGIKTILLVPVVPHGVLQLGSLEKVAEDLGVVAYIKDKFFTHQNLVGYSESLAVNREFLGQSSSLLVSALMDNVNESSAFTMNEMKSEVSMAIDNVKVTIHKPSTENQSAPPCKARDSTHVSGTDMPKMLNSSTYLSGIDMPQMFNSSTENDIIAQLGVFEMPESLRQSLDCGKLGMLESSVYRCLEEELPDFSYSNNSNIEMFGEYANMRLMNETLVNKDSDNMGQTDVGPFLSFPRDCELHKALGPTFLGKTNGYTQDSSISGEDVYSSSSLLCNGDLICSTDSSAKETNGGLVNRDDAEHLLRSVVANIHFDENSSTKTDGVNCPSGQFVASAKGQNQTKRSALGGESTLLGSHVTSSFVSRGRNLIASSSPSATSYESVITELIEEEELKNRFGYLHQKKSSKLSGANKRRGKPGDKQKLRPRDRQLIQDRLKELRELVPNGAKCSIDGLLDRTVAHMLFLRSVSGRADKLKQWVHPERAGWKNTKSPEKKVGSQNGTSWALDLGSDQQICPIVVVDHECPGHMIIEMICDDNGRFLEIAEVIHGLDLTILKGLMEQRSGNTWAHFVIEAPRGLHRLDIFWPLMKLLQQNQSPISSKI